MGRRDESVFATILDAVYTQIWGAGTRQIPEEWRCLDGEAKLETGKISVREFVRAIATSNTYQERFVNAYPQPKVIELMFRHLLGRKPSTQAEIHHYGEILRQQGFVQAVNTIIDSSEYEQFFGNEVVPYQRTPILATNYLGSIKTE